MKLTNHQRAYFSVFFVFFLLGGYFHSIGQTSILIKKLAETKCKSHFNSNSNQSISAISANGQNIDVIHYGCHWWINPANDSIRGKVAITFKAKVAGLSQLTLDMANNLQVTSIRFRNGSPTHSFSNSTTLAIDLSPQFMDLGTVDSVVIWYRGRPIPSPFGSFTRTSHEGIPIIYTLSEPFGAKDWWPCKEALNDKADSIDFTIYSPSDFRAVSNGLLVSETNSAGIRTAHWKHKYPCATYLMAIAVTNYAHFRYKAVLSSGDTLPIDNYCYPESEAAWSVEMAPIVQIIQDFDSTLAPYPFSKEKYGHAEFAFGGGMEHQTISFMENTSISLQAHELVHHWFGDKITCGSWQDVWLNEGFATFFAGQQEVKISLTPWTAITDNWINYIISEPGGSVFCPDTTDLNRIFSSRLSYYKGAMVLNMLKFKMGETNFNSAIRSYLANPSLAYRFARTPDFKFQAEQASGLDLTEFFADWIYGEGYPIYSIDASVNGNQVELNLSQTSSHPSVSFFEGKIPIQFSGPGGDTTVFVNHVQNNQLETFTLSFSPTTVNYDIERQLIGRWTGTFTSSDKTINRFKSVKISPNPASDFIQLNDVEFGTYLEIINSVGKAVSGPELISAGSFKMGINLNPGCYYLRFSNKNGGFDVEKLLVE